MILDLLARALVARHPTLDDVKRAPVAVPDDVRDAAYVRLWVPDPEAEIRLNRQIQEILDRRAAYQAREEEICARARLALENSVFDRLRAATLGEVLSRLRPNYVLSRVTAKGHKPRPVSRSESRFRARKLDPNRYIPVPGILACVDGSTIQGEKGRNLPEDWLVNHTFKIDNERAWRVRRGLPAENLEMWGIMRGQKRLRTRLNTLKLQNLRENNHGP